MTTQRVRAGIMMMTGGGIDTEGIEEADMETEGDRGEMNGGEGTGIIGEMTGRMIGGMMGIEEIEAIGEMTGMQEIEIIEVIEVHTEEEVGSMAGRVVKRTESGGEVIEEDTIGIMEIMRVIEDIEDSGEVEERMEIDLIDGVEIDMIIEILSGLVEIAMMIWGTQSLSVQSITTVTWTITHHQHRQIQITI